MRDEVPSGSAVRIWPCANAGQPIAMIPFGRDALGDAVLRDDGAASRLSAYPDYFATEPRTLDSLVSGLWSTFGSAVVAGGYSVNRGAFRPFDDDDWDFIRSALAYEED